MRILLIGGTGNLSADCARVLHEQGHQIWVVKPSIDTLCDEVVAAWERARS